MKFTKFVTKEQIKNNFLFTVVVGIEIIVLLIILITCFEKKRKYDVPVDSIKAENAEGVLVTYSENGVHVQNTDSQDKPLQFFSEKQKMSSGTYELTIEYISERSLENPSYNLHDKSATCCFISATNPSAIKMNDIVLDDGHSVVNGRVRIATGSFLDDVQLSMYYTGNGQLQVKKIHLEELVAGRWMRLLGFINLFTVIDILYLMFMGNTTDQIIRSLLKKKKAFIGILGITIVASIPYFADFIFVGHDMDFHMQRIVAVAEELENHQFPVRIDSGTLNDYGYVNSLYYCDIFLYIPAILYNCTLLLYRCYQIYGALINFGTVAIAYFVYNKMTNDKIIALLGAALYALSAYRLTNVYIRAAVGEYTAMMFLPLVVYGVWKIYVSEKPTLKIYLPLALGVAGIAQCHVLTMEMVVLFLILICILAFRKTFKVNRIVAYIKAALIAVLLSAWFIVPFISSMCNMKVNANTINNKIQSSGLYPIQLINIFMGGSGDSVVGMRGEMPLTIGLPLIMGIVIVLYCCFHRTQWRLEKFGLYTTLRICFGFAILSSLMTMYFFPWDYIENIFGLNVSTLFGAVQYSWRYLSLTMIFLVTAMVISMYILKSNSITVYKKCLKYLVLMMIMSTGVFFWNFSGDALEYCYETMDNASTMYVGGGEYLPVNTDRDKLYVTRPETNSQDIVLDNYEKVSGIAFLTCNNNGYTEAEITFPILKYDNYKVYDQESRREYMIQTGDNNRIKVAIEAGYNGTLCVEYVPPVLWRIAEVVSLVSVFVIGVILTWQSRYGNKHFGRNIGS